MTKRIFDSDSIKHPGAINAKSSGTMTAIPEPTIHSAVACGKPIRLMKILMNSAPKTMR